MRRRQCGSCTVHIDGQAVRSCALPATAVGARQVTTIEGVSGKVARAVQEAWNRLDVVQCGYCPVRADHVGGSAALPRSPKPTDAQIDAAMTGNLCRCATYVRIRAASTRRRKAL
jgi:isoquinoline 1-oxidoreductase alpha subunit